MEQLHGLWEILANRGLPATILLLAAIFILRWLTLRYLRRDRRLPKELKLRWQNFIKNAFVIAAIIGLIMIWAPQLRAFALSLTALAVATVIATKELILCISGSLLRASSSTFQIGDLVEYAGHKGYVVEQSLLSTQLQKVDPDNGMLSGDQVVLPNSLFLTHAVVNYSHLHPYCVHAFTIFMDSNRLDLIEPLLQSTQELARRLSEKAMADREFNQLAKWKRQLLQSSAPQVRLTSNGNAKVGFMVSVICQESQSMHYEAEIARHFFGQLAASPKAETA